jgi:DNA-binding NtrC family response regulator
MLIDPNVLLLASEPKQAGELTALLSPYLRVKSAQDMNGLETALRNRRFDAILYVREETAWREPLETIRLRHPETPVIMLTRSAARLECAAMVAAGAFDFLVPPYGNRNVLAAVEQAVATTQARAWHDSKALA